MAMDEFKVTTDRFDGPLDLMLHLIRETNRHAGHVDIIRESLDGKTAFTLVAEAGGTAG